MMLEQKISWFKSTTDTECVRDNSTTIGVFLERFKNGFYKDSVNKVRLGDKEEKKRLPTIAFHGVFDGWRKKDLFVESSGLVILDIDGILGDLESIKQDIMDSYDSVLSCFVSPSGKGIKVLYYVTPDLINSSNYRAMGKELVSNFEVYGKVDFLSVTDTLIATHDPNLIINKDAVPDFVYLKEFSFDESELKPIDSKKEVWEDAEDFFDTVLLPSILERANNNYHFIQISVLDLAKFGFKSNTHDLSFIVSYAELNFKPSPENETRLTNICKIAENIPQKKHPYRTVLSNDKDDGYINYNEFKNEPLEELKSINSDVIGDEFIDYAKFFDKVLITVNEGDRVGYEISLKEFADGQRFKGSGIFTLTGIPGHGKTEMLDAITLDLARLYGQQTLVAGFEQSPEEHVVKLMRKLEGRDVRCKTWQKNDKGVGRLKKLYNFVTSKIIHLDTNKTGGNINSILEAFATKINNLRNNGGDPRYVVIDPFNMLSVKGNFSNHEKVEEILRRITHFSHQMNILVFLVAHPFKMKKDEKTGVYEVPDFYSVKGSSAFFEMSYHGGVVYRNGTMVMYRVLKVKQNNLGTTGSESWFTYDRSSGRYIPSDDEGNEQKGCHRDKDWLEKALIAEKNNYK